MAILWIIQTGNTDGNFRPPSLLYLSPQCHRVAPNSTWETNARPFQRPMSCKSSNVCYLVKIRTQSMEPTENHECC